MIIGTGVDLVDAGRVRQLIERYGDRFLHRVFLPAEIQHCKRSRACHLEFAARIAAKEAGSKAIGTGWRHGVHWRCFEVRPEPSGRPALLLHGTAKKIADKLGVRRILLSLSHDREFAVAHVIMES